MIPQAVYHEPLMRHAVIAMRALHENRERSSCLLTPAAEAEEEFYLSGYGRVFRFGGTGFEGGQSIDVCLFVVFCFLLLFSAFGVSAFVSFFLSFFLSSIIDEYE